MRLNSIVLKTLLIFFIAIIATMPLVYGLSDINPDQFKVQAGQGTDTQNLDKIREIGGKIWRTLSNIAAIVSVVVIALVGFRYMIGSVDQKAEYKETMLPIIIGCFLVGGLPTLINLIYNAAK